MIAQLSVLTRTPPQVWDEVLQTDPQMFVTVIEVLAKGGVSDGG